MCVLGRGGLFRRAARLPALRWAGAGSPALVAVSLGPARDRCLCAGLWESEGRKEGEMDKDPTRTADAPTQGDELHVRSSRPVSL